MQSKLRRTEIQNLFAQLSDTCSGEFLVHTSKSTCCVRILVKKSLCTNIGKKSLCTNIDKEANGWQQFYVTHCKQQLSVSKSRPDFFLHISVGLFSLC